MTTGNPISCAALAASLGATTRDRGMVTPKAARAALPACSVRVRTAAAPAPPEGAAADASRAPLAFTPRASAPVPAAGAVVAPATAGDDFLASLCRGIR